MYRELDGTQLLYKISSHHTEGPEMRAVMKEFNNCKRRLHEGDDFGIELPKPLNNLDMGNRVIQGELAITKSVTAHLFFHSLLMLTSGEMQSFFDPCVRRIIGLIQDQVAQVEMQRKRLKVQIRLTTNVSHSADFIPESFPSGWFCRIHIFARRD